VIVTGLPARAALHAGKSMRISPTPAVHVEVFRCDSCAMRRTWFRRGASHDGHGEQLFRAKGLCNVVVCAEFEKQKTLSSTSVLALNTTIGLTLHRP